MVKVTVILEMTYLKHLIAWFLTFQSQNQAYGFTNDSLKLIHRKNKEKVDSVYSYCLELMV